MSQSPIDDFSEEATLSYKQGWRALNRLLHEDRSFSGHERNCAFLNTGGASARFADVSAVTAFDFDDDARGLATVDWDFDGDLDVWITNRTAPRVRLLRNNSPETMRFVALKLEGNGTTCNRDAIGARLELHLSGTPAPAPVRIRIRTLHGGEGFLSQSSNWIHFGIGSQGTIDKLVVKWPDGAEQVFSGISPGQFYKLKQDRATPLPFTPPADRITIEVAAQVPQPVIETTRTIVAPGLPIPDITVTAASGTDQPLTLSNTRPTLINLWSSTCAACLHELAEWSKDADQLAAAGLDIAILNTDHLSGEDRSAKSLETLARASSSFTKQSITASGVQSLDDLQRAVFDRWQPIPLPSSFLVAASGELIAIYKGPVSTSQLLADLTLTDATPEARRQAATPFSGRWVDKPVESDPKRVSSIMLDHNRLEAAQKYLAKCTRYFEALDSAVTSGGKRRLGDLNYAAAMLIPTDPASSRQRLALLSRARDLIPEDMRARTALGRQLLDLGRLREALPEFAAAAEINPSDLGLRQDIGLMHFRLGEYGEAKRILTGVVASEPGNGLAQYHLANSEVRLHQLPAAIDGYRKALSSAPQLLDAANSLSWILASHPDEKLRSPDEALALAQRLCSITKNQNPRFLDTLSVALANRGDFENAILAADQAIALYGDDSEQATARIVARRELYNAGTPYREESWQ